MSKQMRLACSAVSVLTEVCKECLMSNMQILLLFFYANHEQVINLTCILGLYGMISGLKVKFHKSTVAGVCCADHLVINEAQFLGCNIVHFPYCFLGLPLCGGCIKGRDWGPVMDRFEKRLSSWNGRFLSMGGKLTLIG